MRMERFRFFGGFRNRAIQAARSFTAVRPTINRRDRTGFATRRIVLVGRGRHVARRAALIRLTKCGAHCRTCRLIPPGQGVIVCLMTPHRLKVECEGMVVNSHAGGAETFAAIVFTALRGRGAEELRLSLTELSRSRCVVA